MPRTLQALTRRKRTAARGSQARAAARKRRRFAQQGNREPSGPRLLAANIDIEKIRKRELGL